MTQVAEVHAFPSSTVTQHVALWIAQRLLSLLSTSHKTCLLLSGGSSIPMYQQLIQHLPATADFSSFTIGLVDERFGPMNHIDSNEHQLRAAGIIDFFETRGATFVGMLSDASDPHEASQKANQAYQQVVNNSSQVVLLLGMGPDGHTAGWLPMRSLARFQHTFDVEADVIYYQLDPQDTDNPLTQRFTTTLHTLRQSDQVIVYATGAAKKTAVQHFLEAKLPINEVPSIALYLAKNIPVLLTSNDTL